MTGDAEKGGSALALRSGEGLGADVLANSDPGQLGGGSQLREFVVGQTDRDGVGARVVRLRPAGTWGHDEDNNVYGKVLREGYFRVYNKSMTKRTDSQTTDIDYAGLAALSQQGRKVTTGAEVQVGEPIAFVPGGRAIRFARIDSERHLHSTLNMTYRLAYEFDGTGYVLFCDQTIWPAS